MDVAAALQGTLDGAVLVKVRTRPAAAREGVVGLDTWRGELEVAVRAPAQDGRANAALLGVLAEALDVPRAAVSLASGATARAKVVRIEDPSLDDVAARLAAMLEVG